MPKQDAGARVGTERGAGAGRGRPGRDPGRTPAPGPRAGFATGPLGAVGDAVRLQRAYGNQAVGLLLAAGGTATPAPRPGAAAGPGVIQRFKIYPPGVLGTPGIEVENSDPFKKHIRGWEKEGELGVAQIRKYLQRLEAWLTSVDQVVENPDPAEKARVAWAIGWVNNRLAALEPKPPAAAEKGAGEGGKEKEPPKPAPAKGAASGPTPSSPGITIPAKGKVRSAGQRLNWVKQLDAAALDGRSKLDAILKTKEGDRSVGEILQLGGEGGVYIKTKTSALIGYLAAQLGEVVKLCKPQQDWVNGEVAKLVVGQSLEKAAAEMRTLLDGIADVYGYAMEIEDLNELQMISAKKAAPVWTYDHYDLSRAVRSIVGGRREVRSDYLNREGFLTPGRAYLEYQVGEGSGGGAGERRIMVEQGRTDTVYYTKGATHTPSTSRFQAFGTNPIVALGFLYKGDEGKLRPS